MNFTKRLCDYDCIIGLDLSLHNTGYFVSYTYGYDCGNIPYSGSSAAELYEPFKALIEKYVNEYGEDNVLIIREQRPMGCPNRSTINTISQLAAVHSIMDLVVLQMGVDELPPIPVSTIRATLKKKWNVSGIDKDMIFERYHAIFPYITTNDQSDAYAVLETTDFVWWNRCLKAEIKALKEKQSEYKSEKSKATVQAKIDYLEEFIF